MQRIGATSPSQIPALHEQKGWIRDLPAMDFSRVLARRGQRPGRPESLGPVPGPDSEAGRPIAATSIIGRTAPPLDPREAVRRLAPN